MPWVTASQKNNNSQQPSIGGWVTASQKDQIEQQKAQTLGYEQANQAIQSQQDYRQRVADRSQRGLWSKIQAAGSGVKSFLGINKQDVLPEVQNAPQQYNMIRQQQQFQDEYQSNLAGRAGNALAGAGQWVTESFKKAQEESAKMTPEEKRQAGSPLNIEKTRVQTTVGGTKSTGELASGTAKLGAEFSPLTGFSGLRKITKFVGGEKTDEWVDRNTPEYQKKVDAFVDENGILNYKPEYANEAQKMGGEVAEIGSWLVPITRAGKISKIEKTLAEIPKFKKLLGVTPKIVKSGGKLFFEVGKDSLDIAILEGLRGKDWEQVKQETEMGGIGALVLRSVGGTFGKIFSKIKSSKAGKIIAEAFPDMNEAEAKLVADMLEQKRTIDDISEELNKMREIGVVKETTPVVDDVAKAIPENNVSAKEEPTQAAEEIKNWISYTTKPSEDTLKYLEKNKLGVDEIKFDKDGTITAYRDGKIKPGELQSYSLTKKDDFQLPTTLTKDEVVLNTMSKKVDDLYERTFKADELAYNKESLDKFRNLEAEILARKKLEHKTPKFKPQQLEKEATKPKESKVESDFAKRLNEDLPDNLKISEEYNVAGLKDEAEKAADIIAKDKEKAFRIASGIEKTDVNTQTAMSIALAEKAKKQGDWELVSSLYNQRRIANTRRGQEIAMEKLSVAINPEEKFMADVVAARTNKVKIGGRDFKKGMTKSEKATKKIKNQTDSLKKNFTQTYKIEEAQSLLNKLTCK